MRRTHPTTALALLTLLVVTACATPHDVSKGREWGRTRLLMDDTGGRLRACTEKFATIDDAIERAGTRDAQTAQIPGFPYLRTTRFLAALGPKISDEDDAAFDYWNGWLAATAIKARAFELANMPRSDRAELQRRLDKSPEAVIGDCTTAIRTFDKKRDEARETLFASVNVPDHYIDWFRVVGVYPLTSFPVKIGFERWKEKNLPSFERSPSDLEIEGTVVRYVYDSATSPVSHEAVADLLQRQSDNPLRIPLPTDAQLHRLAATFAPVFSVDVTGLAKKKMVFVKSGQLWRLKN